MEYERDYPFEDYLIKLIHDREFHKREGIHQSDLNYCINKSYLRRKLGNPIDRTTTLLFSLGWSTQAFLTSKFHDATPIVLDGITVTCDWLICPECKGTIG